MRFMMRLSIAILSCSSSHVANAMAIMRFFMRIAAFLKRRSSSSFSFCFCFRSISISARVISE